GATRPRWRQRAPVGRDRERQDRGVHSRVSGGGGTGAQRDRARAGDRADAAAVLHSALTEAERRDERERIAAGEARVVVGARSAIFAPVRSLGVICID